MKTDRHPSTLIVVGVALVLLACAAQKPGTVSHPGAINQFDSQAYDSLVTAQGAIDAARPLAVSSAQKAIFNKVAASYNEAKNAYLLYHTQLASGGQVDTTALSNQLTALVQSTAVLAGQLRGTP